MNTGLAFWLIVTTGGAVLIGVALACGRTEATRWAVTSVTCELPSMIGSALGIGTCSMTNWRGQDSSATFVEHLN